VTTTIAAKSQKAGLRNRNRVPRVAHRWRASPPTGGGGGSDALTPITARFDHRPHVVEDVAQHALGTPCVEDRADPEGDTKRGHLPLDRRLRLPEQPDVRDPNPGSPLSSVTRSTSRETESCRASGSSTARTYCLASSAAGPANGTATTSRLPLLA